MGRPNKLDDAQAGRLRRAFAAGTTLKALSQRFGVDVNTVKRYCEGVDRQRSSSFPNAHEVYHADLDRAKEWRMNSEN